MLDIIICRKGINHGRKQAIQILFSRHEKLITHKCIQDGIQSNIGR